MLMLVLMMFCDVRDVMCDVKWSCNDWLLVIRFKPNHVYIVATTALRARFSPIMLRKALSPRQ